jgi:hypothetical protein
MITAGKINVTGERELKKHLKAHLGRGFCPSRRSVHMLSDGHGEITCGTTEFTYPGKEQPETVDWSEKRLDDEITRYLQRHLVSKKVKPSDVKHVQVVAGGDHGDAAFQFGASVTVDLHSGKSLDFEVLVCELICRTESGPMIEKTILTTLTAGLEVVATTPVHIYEDNNNELCVKFEKTGTQDSHTSNEINVDVYITGDLSFQAMVLGKESMAPHWCMLCKAHKDKFLDNNEMWTMEDLVQAGMTAETSIGDPQLGVKKQPWWSFIPLHHYIVPLLHCEIGIGNQLLGKLRDIVNEHIESMTLAEAQIRSSIPLLRDIIEEIVDKRDAWDECPDQGKKMNRLARGMTTNRQKQEYYRKQLEREDSDVNIEYVMSKISELEMQYTHDEEEHRPLRTLRDNLANKLMKTRKAVSIQLNKLKDMRSEKVKKMESIETKMFKVLKAVGVELSAYHGGSLNGKDIQKVMHNASHIFDSFATIFKEGKRPNCSLTDEDIEQLCLHFREVFVLWDGAFSVGRTEHPTESDFVAYRLYVDAAVQGSIVLGCSITPKIHAMVKHVEYQMRNLRGGLGDKVEDWVERLHQTGIRLRLRFRTVKNPLLRAIARDKSYYCSMHPDVIAHGDAVNEGSKRNLTNKNIDPVAARQKRQREVGRSKAMQYFESIKDKRLTWMTLLTNDARLGVVAAAAQMESGSSEGADVENYSVIVDGTR